ncbi:hypothetical protein B0T13DRAFT_511955 [Neurospora crassa]|nr:hypothetical protein B0T13DRAFT_511955 [Neurospora crassa]
MDSHNVMMAMLQAFHVSQDDEQRLPGSEAQAPAQASTRSSRLEYFMNAIKEDVSDDMLLRTPPPYRPESPFSEADLDSYPILTSSPGSSPTRRPLVRVRSMPAIPNVAGSYMNGRFSSTGTAATGGDGAATKLPLPISLQTPTQASAPNRVTKASSHIQHKSFRDVEFVMLALDTFVEQGAFARRVAKLARRSQPTARLQERRMANGNKRNLTRLQFLEQQLIAQVRSGDASWRIKDPGFGMNESSAAAGAGGGVPPPLSWAMEEDGSSGYGQVQEEYDPGHTSSLDGNVSDSDHMEMEVEQEEDLDSLYVNISSDEEMDEGPPPPIILELRRAGLSYQRQMDMVDMMDSPSDTASMDVDVGSDDEEMDEGPSPPISLELGRAGLYLGRMDNMDPLSDTASMDVNVGSDDEQMEE